MAKANAKSAAYSMEKANEMMKQYVKADQDYTKEKNDLAKKTNDLAAKYAKALTDADKLKKEAEQWLEQFAKNNTQLFTHAKNVQIGSGEIGYRTGKHKVELILEEEIVIKNLKKFLQGGGIKTVETIDKAKIISDRKNISEKTLKKCGIEIKQEENFYTKSLEKIV